MSVDISPECRPKCWSSIGRYLGRLSAEISDECRPIVSVKYRPTLSVERRSSIGRGSVGRVSTRTIGRISAEMSVDYRPTLSAECRSIVGWGRVGRVSTRTIGRVSANTIGQVSTDRWRVCRVSAEISSNTLHPHTPPPSRLTLGRYSTDISADTWARYRPTLGRDIDRHFVER